MASRALVVAAIAGVLLVVSIGVDAALNRSWTLDVQTPDGWRTLTQTGGTSDGMRAVMPLSPLAVERNGTVHLRVTVDNGYLWGYDATYRVLVNGAEVTRGALHAAARETGAAEFDVPARLAFVGAAEPVKGAPNAASLSLEVLVGSQSLYGYVPLQEAPS